MPSLAGTIIEQPAAMAVLSIVFVVGIHGSQSVGTAMKTRLLTAWVVVLCFAIGAIIWATVSTIQTLVRTVYPAPNRPGKNPEQNEEAGGSSKSNQNTRWFPSLVEMHACPSGVSVTLTRKSRYPASDPPPLLSEAGWSLAAQILSVGGVVRVHVYSHIIGVEVGCENDWKYVESTIDAMLRDHLATHRPTSH